MLELIIAVCAQVLALMAVLAGFAVVGVIAYLQLFPLYYRIQELQRECARYERAQLKTSARRRADHAQS